jgi:DNA invertase Pin-like site-specific DNA recombinase
MGFVVSDELIFKDEALSGQEHTYEKRDGFHALDKAWTQHRFDVLLVEEFSRLSRDGVEHAKLIRRLENDRRVRMVTLDGIDTNDHDWQLRLGLQGVLAQSEVRKTRDRVKRGMIGQLERGYMIAAPAFGYDIHREFDAVGNRIGTHWRIDDAEARIVQQIFAKRVQGMSYNQIAVWLNTSGVPCQRKGRDEHGGFWRPSSIRRLLTNSIYRGVFVWHGSVSYHSCVTKRGEAVETREFLRPQLRLVDDDVWTRCNMKSISRSGYGGGKNPYSGLVVCGYCDKPLSSSAINKRCQSMYCSSCTLAKSIDEQHERMTSTVAVTGVNTLFREALRQFLTPAFVEAFRRSLRKSRSVSSNSIDTEKLRSACRGCWLALTWTMPCWNCATTRREAKCATPRGA